MHADESRSSHPASHSQGTYIPTAGAVQLPSYFFQVLYTFLNFRVVGLD
jgi:hypothetical protein